MLDRTTKEPSRMRERPSIVDSDTRKKKNEQIEHDDGEESRPHYHNNVLTKPLEKSLNS